MFTSSANPGNLTSKTPSTNSTFGNMANLQPQFTNPPFGQSPPAQPFNQIAKPPQTSSLFGPLGNIQSKNSSFGKNQNEQPFNQIDKTPSGNVPASGIFGQPLNKELQKQTENLNQNQKQIVQTRIPAVQQDKEYSASNKENQKQGMISQKPLQTVQEIAINSGVQLPSTSSGGHISISAKSAKNNNEEEILKIIADLTKEIDEMRKDVNKDEDIERYVSFLQKNIQKAYCYWSLGELTMKMQFFQWFFDFTINPIYFGSDSKSKITLYKNELTESKHLVFYIIMALVHLGRLEEAFGALKFWLLHWNNNIELIQGEIQEFQVGEWNLFLSEDPMEDIKDVVTNHGKDNGSRVFLLSCLIAIKSELIVEMKRRFQDRKLVYQAFEQENNVLIAKLIERNPDLEEVKLCDVNKVFLEGMDSTTFQKEFQNQIKCLKHYIQLCHNMSTNEHNLHPSFVTEILNSDKEIVTKMSDYHIQNNVYRQKCEYASLASCVSYFAKLSCKEKGIYKLIMDEVKSVEGILNPEGFVSRIINRKRPRSPNENMKSEETTAKKAATSSI